MAALVFKKCCGCIGLKYGSFVIGYLNLIFNLFITIIFVTFAVENAGMLNTSNRIFYLITVIASPIVLLCIWITAISLLVGLHQNIPQLVKGYMSSVMWYALWMSRICIFDSGLSPAEKALTTAFIIIVSLYFCLVIRSMYHRMKETQQATTGAAVEYRSNEPSQNP